MWKKNERRRERRDRKDRRTKTDRQKDSWTEIGTNANAKNSAHGDKTDTQTKKDKLTDIGHTRIQRQRKG